MTKEAWIDYLLEIDDSKNAESPRGFKDRPAQQRFLKLITKLNRQFNIDLSYESGMAIQDSSFHAQATIPQEWVVDSDYILQLRASNFGNLLAIVDDDRMMKADKLEIIQQFALEIHYQYVPSEILLEKYTGHNKGVTGFNSWMYRYFDWI